MANILDYLDWRGDVPFSVDPFNDVDNLILSEIAYTDFEGIDSVIAGMMDNPQIKKAVARTNLFNMWDKLLPEKYKKKSHRITYVIFMIK